MMTLDELLCKKNTTIINLENQVDNVSLFESDYQNYCGDCGDCGDCVCDCWAGNCDGFSREVIL